MAHSVPSQEPQRSTQDPPVRPRRRDKDAGEVAADHASDLYAEQEHESRRERFERQVNKAATATP